MSTPANGWLVKSKGLGLKLGRCAPVFAKSLAMPSIPEAFPVYPVPGGWLVRLPLAAISHPRWPELNAFAKGFQAAWPA